MRGVWNLALTGGRAWFWVLVRGLGWMLVWGSSLAKEWDISEAKGGTRGVFPYLG